MVSNCVPSHALRSLSCTTIGLGIWLGSMRDLEAELLGCPLTNDVRALDGSEGGCIGGCEGGCCCCCCC